MPAHGVIDTTLCDKVLLMTCGSPVVFQGPVHSTNKTDSHNMTAIFLKVTFKTITLTHF
jgi:ABC-type uncharacterized transport system ATPase subunit